LDKESLDWQIKNSDLPKETERIKQYLDKGLPLEHRVGTRQDIKNFLDDGWLVMLEVNENVIAGIEGYLGHVVLVVGYDDNNVAIHNPDGNNGNKPNQVISWALLEQAWILAAHFHFMLLRSSLALCYDREYEKRHYPSRTSSGMIEV